MVKKTAGRERECRMYPAESRRISLEENFAPDRVPQGIDSRGGFILLKEERTSPSAKDSAIDLYTYPVETRISFDYSDIEGDGEMKAGYYYGVKNVKEGG
jgi:hypothetical protein